MIPDKREFLINEYSSLNQLISTLATIAYSILSGGVVVFGSLLANVGRGGVHDAYMLALVPTVLSLILGQLTHASYFFCYFRMLDIAKEFEVNDLWSRWEKVLSQAREKRHFLLFGVAQYAGSFPMAVVLYIGVIVTPIYVFWQLGWGAAFFFSLVMSLLNFWLTYNRLEPLSFYQRIEKDLRP